MLRIKACTRLVSFTRLYIEARSTEHKVRVKVCLSCSFKWWIIPQASPLNGNLILLKEKVGEGNAVASITHVVFAAIIIVVVSWNVFGVIGLLFFFWVTLIYIWAPALVFYLPSTCTYVVADSVISLIIFKTCNCFWCLYFIGFLIFAYPSRIVQISFVLL